MTQLNFFMEADNKPVIAAAAIIPDEAAAGTTPAPASPYADIFLKYKAKAAKNEEDARYFTTEKMQAIAERIERAVAEKNFDNLRSLRFRDLNPISRDIFTRITGVILPKLQKDCLAVIREFVGAEAVAAYEASKQNEREERSQKNLRERLSYRYVHFEKRRISTRQFIDEILARGFTVLSERKHGAAPEYGIAKPDGTRYVLRRKDERDYAALRLKELSAADSEPQPDNATQ